MVAVTLRANGQVLSFKRVLVDTGSGGTIFKTDDLETIGVKIQGTDRVRVMFGIGGEERVIEKQIDTLEVGSDLSVSPFTIEMGRMAYRMEIDGILGMNFLLAAKAVIDLDTLTLTRRRI